MANVNTQLADFAGARRSDRWTEGILAGPRAIVWVITSAVLLRGIAWFRYDPVTFDSALYFEMAEFMRAGRWSEALAYDYPPLYSFLIAGLQPVVGSVEAAGLLVAFLADLLLLWPILAIARRAVGEDAAWGAAFLWAVHLSGIRLGVQALSDAPTAMCVAAALALGLRAFERRRLAGAVGAGMLSGAAFLFRPEGLEPALGLAAFYALSRNRKASGVTVSDQRSAVSGQPREETTRPAWGAQRAVRGGRVIRRMGWILAPLVGWAIVAAPYVAHISVEAGTLTLSKKKSAMGFVRSAVPLVAPESREPDSAARSPMASRLVRWAHNLYVFQKPLVNGLTVVIILPMCIGWWAVVTRRRNRWNPALALFGGLFVLHVAILIGLAADKGPAYLGMHHFLLTAVYALPVAGGGLVWTLGWATGRSGGHRWIAAAALCLTVAATGLAVAARGPEQGRSLRAAAAWIRSEVADTPVIATGLAKLTYHANAKRVDMTGTYDEILQRARDRYAQFVALYPNLVGQMSPDFLARVSAADMELVKIFPEPSSVDPDQRLELYRVRPRASAAGS